MFRDITHNGELVLDGASTATAEITIEVHKDSEVQFMMKTSDTGANTVTVGIPSLKMQRISTKVPDVWYSMGLDKTTYPLYDGTGENITYTFYPFAGGFRYKITLEDDNLINDHDLFIDTSNAGL